MTYEERSPRYTQRRVSRAIRRMTQAEVDAICDEILREHGSTISNRNVAWARGFCVGFSLAIFAMLFLNMLFPIV